MLIDANNPRAKCEQPDRQRTTRTCVPNDGNSIVTNVDDGRTREENAPASGSASAARIRTDRDDYLSNSK